jgi:cytochrome c peroxidase
MTFLMDFTHRPNPSTVGRSSWTPLERRGAAVFRDRCESCHEARLIADEPSSRVAFDRWEELVMSQADALVWAHADYEKTGVLPYVNEKGARVVSLRRLYKKHPYFTNGTAPEIADVLDRVRFTGGASGAFFHEGAPDGATALRPDEKTALAAFVDLL